MTFADGLLIGVLTGWFACVGAWLVTEWMKGNL